MANHIATAFLSEIAEALESDAELAGRVRAALGIETAPSGETLSLKETGIPVRTLRAAIASGELPAVKVGREYRVRRADLDRWLESQKVEPGQRPAKPRKQSAAERAIARARRDGSLRVVGGTR